MTKLPITDERTKKRGERTNTTYTHLHFEATAYLSPSPSSDDLQSWFGNEKVTHPSRTHTLRDREHERATSLALQIVSSPGCGTEAEDGKGRWVSLLPVYGSDQRVSLSLTPLLLVCMKTRDAQRVSSCRWMPASSVCRSSFRIAEHPRPLALSLPRQSALT